MRAAELAPCYDPVSQLVYSAGREHVSREEMKRMADIFRGRIIDVTDKDYTIELTGDDAAKMQKLIDVLEDLDDVQGVFHNAEINE